MDGNEPDIPFYKVVESTGPTNTRIYKVAVYFRDKRLASSTGHSIQQAEMNAAKKALENSKNLFPQLDHQRRVIEKSLKHQKVKNINNANSLDDITDSDMDSKSHKLSDNESKLPTQYQARRGSNLSDISEISSVESDLSSVEEESDSSLKFPKRRRKIGVKADTTDAVVPKVDELDSKLDDYLSPMSDGELEMSDDEI